MAHPQKTPIARVTAGTLIALLLIISGCGGGSSDNGMPLLPMPTPEPTGESTPEPTPEPEPTGSPEECDEINTYESTWEGIYEQIFVQQQCADGPCHGSNAAAGLDLSPEVAWANIHEIPSQTFDLDLIEPGTPMDSYLYLKVLAKLDPEGVEIAGGAMPTGNGALSTDDIELLRLWIKNGAQEDGTVAGTAELLGACLPEELPQSIRPLDAPDPSEGVQLIMPSYLLPAASEREVCFATYYDFCGQIPEEYLTERDTSSNQGQPRQYGQRFRIEEYNLRQDAQSHHAILMEYTGYADVDAPEFGDWTCSLGSKSGESCDPKEQGACDDGFCISRIVDTPGCTGFGPPGGPSPLSSTNLLTVQQTSEKRSMPEGVFDEMPCEGIFYWNSHAFNLTGSDLEMNGRLNWTFAEDAQIRSLQIFDADQILSISIPAYEEKTFCQSWVAPQGSRVYNLLSHYHQRGKEFLVYDPDGELVYQNFSYNDPLNKYFDPPLEMDSPDVEDRTFRYCATYNNGYGENGEPDPSVVKRASETPQNSIFGRCTPTNCWSGQVGKPCNGLGDDATCDSTPGEGDGLCDACPVNGGVSTEDEMFLILGAYYIGEE